MKNLLELVGVLCVAAWAGLVLGPAWSLLVAGVAVIAACEVR